MSSRSLVSDSVATIITKRHPVIIHYRQEHQTLIQKQTLLLYRVRISPLHLRLTSTPPGSQVSPASANAR
jgi:hypothetical protein